MFTYIDAAVRRRLNDKGVLFELNAEGMRTEGRDAKISVLGPIPLPLTLGELQVTAQWYACVRKTELGKIEELAEDLRAQDGQRSFATLANFMAVNSVLLLGDSEQWKNPLVRVHSSCLTGDVFGSERCECGPQLQSALQRIERDPDGGVLVYMSGHEGRGIGLWAKAATYLLQDSGEDTYEANRSLGLPDDSRDFSDAAILLKHFVGNKPLRLLTNNPKKIADLASFGVDNVQRVKHVMGVGDNNRRYLSAKQTWGHKISGDDLKLTDSKSTDSKSSD